MADDVPSFSERTASRKEEHVSLTVEHDVRFRAKTTGLERLDFVHNALPELNLSDVDPSVTFLGKRIAFPFMISCMTGGYAGALAINRGLAEVCEDLNLCLGVGSQRQALENTRYHESFSIVRAVAPSIPIVGNIGAVEVARMASSDGIRRLVDLVHADAFAVHLNPLQELLQPEGNTDFRGVLRGIAMLAKELPIPLLVKEIGAGISADVARRLLDAGVSIIDVAGAGGTSWAGVETLRNSGHPFGERLWDWGIPTVEAIRSVAALRNSGARFSLIASGGLAHGTDLAKCLALGADLGASARPMLQVFSRSGADGLRNLIQDWMKELSSIMFLTGCRTVDEFHHVKLVERSAS